MTRFRSVGPPWLALILTLEEEPHLLVTTPAAGDAERLAAWLESRDDLRELADLAGTIRDAERETRADRERDEETARALLGTVGVAWPAEEPPA